jgi:hypothetical protein
MTMFDWHATLIESAADRLAFWIEKTREDKANWAPTTDESCNTRSALQVGSECVFVNKRNAALFRSEPFNQEEVQYTSVADCTRDLRSTAKELGDAVRKLSPDCLSQVYETRFGPIPGVVLLQLALGNLYYHGGQVNMIQLLYGDPKFHLPGRD